MNKKERRLAKKAAREAAAKGTNADAPFIETGAEPDEEVKMSISDSARESLDRPSPDANAALADLAKELNEKRRTAKPKGKPEPEPKNDKPSKAAARMTKDGRMRLPPLPRKPKPRPTQDCECGCGNPTKSRFVPGHDSRLRGWILRVERGFVKIGDVPDGERQVVARHVKARRADEAGSGKSGGKKKAEAADGAQQA